MLPKTPRAAARLARPAGSWAWSSLGPIEIRYGRAGHRAQCAHSAISILINGFLAWPPLLLQVEGERWTPHRLTLQLPRSLVPAFGCPLPVHSDGSWLAEHFDQLMIPPDASRSPWVSPLSRCAARLTVGELGRRPADQGPAPSLAPVNCCWMWPPSVRPACDLMVSGARRHRLTSSSPTAGAMVYVRDGGLEQTRFHGVQFSRQALPKPDGSGACCS